MSVLCMAQACLVASSDLIGHEYFQHSIYTVELNFKTIFAWNVKQSNILLECVYVSILT